MAGEHFHLVCDYVCEAGTDACDTCMNLACVDLSACEAHVNLVLFSSLYPVHRIGFVLSFRYLLSA